MKVELDGIACVGSIVLLQSMGDGKDPLNI